MYRWFKFIYFVLFHSETLHQSQNHKLLINSMTVKHLLMFIGTHNSQTGSLTLSSLTTTIVFTDMLKKWAKQWITTTVKMGN